MIIFGAAAAIGALVSVNVDVLTDHGKIDISVANFGFAVAVALYLIAMWYCQDRLIVKGSPQLYVIPAVVGCVLLLGLLPLTIMTTGLLIVAIVAYRQYRPLTGQTVGS